MRPEPWQVTASRVVVSDQWVHLRADDCRAADGRIMDDLSDRLLQSYHQLTWFKARQWLAR